MDVNVGARGFWDSLKSEPRRVRLLALQVGEVAPGQAFHGERILFPQTQAQAEETHGLKSLSTVLLPVPL